MPNSSRWLEDETDNPSYLHQGSKADLIQELKAWIDRRLQAYKDVMEFRVRVTFEKIYHRIQR